MGPLFLDIIFTKLIVTIVVPSQLYLDQSLISR